MFFVTWPRIVILLGLMAIGVVVGLYVSSVRHLVAARQARRNDDCGTSLKPGILAGMWAVLLCGIALFIKS